MRRTWEPGEKKTIRQRRGVYEEVPDGVTMGVAQRSRQRRTRDGCGKRMGAVLLTVSVQPAAVQVGKKKPRLLLGQQNAPNCPSRGDGETREG